MLLCASCGGKGVVDVWLIGFVYQAAREHANQMRMKDSQQREERREAKEKERLAGQSAMLGQMMIVFDCIPEGF